MEEFIKYLSEEYEFDQKWVTNYWNKIKNIPIVENSPEELQQLCLETIVSDRLTSLYEQEQSADFGKVRVKCRNLNESISLALFQTYGEETLNYTDEKYQETINDDDLMSEINENHYGRRKVKIKK